MLLPLVNTTANKQNTFFCVRLPFHHLCAIEIIPSNRMCYAKVLFHYQESFLLSIVHMVVNLWWFIRITDVDVMAWKHFLFLFLSFHLLDRIAVHIVKHFWDCPFLHRRIVYASSILSIRLYVKLFDEMETDAIESKKKVSHTCEFNNNT